MSNNRNRKTNYNKIERPEIPVGISNTEEETKAIDEKYISDIEENPVAAVIEDNSIEAVTIEAKVLKGIVSGCIKLNVRKHPCTDSEIIDVIDANSEVEIIEAAKDDWYEINQCNGKTVGYVMAKFITVK